MNNPERNTNPEYSVPTWEELLLGALVRKVMPPDNPKVPPLPVEGHFHASKGFSMPDGNNLLAIGNSDGGVPTEWDLMIGPPGWQGSSYTLELRQHEGQSRLFDTNSEIPLESTVAEHFLGQLMLAEPVAEGGLYQVITHED